MHIIYPETQMIVDNVPSFTGDFVFCPNSLFFVSLARLERSPSDIGAAVLGQSGTVGILVGQFLGEFLGRTMGTPTIDGPVDPSLTQRGLFTGTEPLEILEQKLDKLVEKTRGPAPLLRDDIPRPLRIHRGDIMSFHWGTSSKLNTVVITTKFDELEFCFDVRYIGHAKETAATFRYAPVRV
jgi:hypothetical protein